MTRYQDKVYRLARRLTGSTHDAEEVAQDTFLRVFRSLEGFRGEARFSTWLYRITTNTALMLRRSRARRRTESLEDYLPRFDGTDAMRATSTTAGRHEPTRSSIAAASREVPRRRFVACPPSTGHRSFFETWRRCRPLRSPPSSASRRRP